MTKSVFATALIVALAAASRGHAAYILESATMGETAQGSGNALIADQYTGARFHLQQTAQVTHIGGHLFGSGSLFGAIAAISGPEGFPAGAPSTFEPLAVTTFEAPPSSVDISIPLSVLLQPGDYALIFGSGRFGASGMGAMPSNNVATAQASFFFTDSADSWRVPITLPFRFTVLGSAVPEPSSIALALVAVVVLVAARRPRCRVAA